MDAPRRVEGSLVESERDLYRQLLELGRQSEVEELLERALVLICDLAQAEQGYIEVQNPYEEGAPSWSTSHGLDGEDQVAVHALLSSGVIRRSLTLGETVSTASAIADPRFKDRESVKRRSIKAVVCAPIGASPFGVVYLQGRKVPGPFGADDRARVELCSHQIASLADRLFLQRQQRSDHVAPLRARFDLDGVTGQSQALATALEELMLAAPLDVTVLLTGATGAGKSSLARVVHRNSRRRTGPFVHINCATLPENVAESELFGVEPGGDPAIQSSSGAVEAARGGTLFLDEIGELPWAAQAKLLQLLQSGSYYRMGASQPESADIRIVASTKRNLQEDIERGRFRDELYYRLRVLGVRIPSLEERRDDIVPLATGYCMEVCQKHDFPQLELSPAAQHLLETSAWPGNVRELLHQVEAGIIRAAGARVARVESSHLFPEKELDDAEIETFQGATRRYQHELVERTLTATGWNVKEAAKRLDVARSYLYKLISSFGLEREGGPDSNP